MSGERQVPEALPQLFHGYDVRNRLNAARASLGIRTSADIFEESQREYERANMFRGTRRRQMRGTLVWERQGRSGENDGSRGGLSEEVVANAERDVAEEMDIVESGFDTGQEGRPERFRGELSEHFERLDARNRENLARADLGFRTSADIFRSQQERAIAERSSGRRRVRSSGGG